MKRLLLCALPLAVTLTPALAAPASGWNCRNEAVEVSCADGGCEVSDGHTPMDVTVSAAEMSACAYSGCWTGTPTATFAAGQFLTFVGVGLPFSTAEDNVADVTVTVDTASRVATILVSGVFAHPAACTAVE